MKRAVIVNRRGFTLVELLVAVAIVSLLCAMAIPRFTKFMARAKRSEAYLVLSGAATAQTSYYAGADHYLFVCGLGTTSCYPDDTLTAQRNQDLLGLSVYAKNSTRKTPGGYTYHWQFDGNYTTNYELQLSQDLVLGNGAQIDLLFVAAGPDTGSQCLRLFDACSGAVANIPSIAHDDITGKTICDILGC